MRLSVDDACKMIEDARRVFVFVRFTEGSGSYIRAHKKDVLDTLKYRDVFHDEPIWINLGGEDGEDVYVN
jgi:hypothetical protein